MVKNLVLNQFLTKMPANDKDFYKFKCSSLNDINSNALADGNIIYERAGSNSTACRLQQKMNFSTKNKRLRTSFTLPSNMSVPYSVVILGELNVGKSALCRNFFRSGLTLSSEKKRKILDECGDELFDESAEDFAKNHHVFERPVFVNGVGNKIRILDVNTEKQFLESNGLDSFDDLHQYLDVFDGCIVAYTLTDYSTFETAKKILKTIAAIQATTDHNFSVVLVGNKCDLARKRQVPTADGIEIAEKFNVKFIETSAILNENLEQLFQGIIRQIRLRDLQRKLEAIEYANLNTSSLNGATNHRQSPAVDERSTNEAASILPKCDQSKVGLIGRCWRKLKRRESKETQLQRCLDFEVL